ncbi:MAG: sulfatase-like hydrolase/transferase [Myxococcota bacterium]
MTARPGTPGFLWRAVVALGAGLVIASLWALAARKEGPDRIVLIVVDTLRRDHVGAYGGDVPTPHIDALAARGQVFTNVVASFHQTSMSMASMFTGRTPSIESGDASEEPVWNSATWCGLRRFAHGPGVSLCIPEGVTTLAESLEAAGYWTIGIASNQFLYEPSGFSRGFDDWIEVDDRSPALGPAHARSVHRRIPVNRAAAIALKRRPTDRFFLYVHYVDVHEYEALNMPYARAVERNDAAIGQLLGHLETIGLLEGAVVVFTSDHGEKLGDYHGLPGELRGQFGHYGNPSMEEVLKVPLIVAPPVFDDPSRFLRSQDVFDLIHEIALIGVDVPRDLAPDELFVGELKYHTYRKGPWKLSVRREDGEALLFDLEDDPRETRNLAAVRTDVVETYRARIRELVDRLAADGGSSRALTEDERGRLRDLGYLEEVEGRAR